MKPKQVVIACLLLLMVFASTKVAQARTNTVWTVSDASGVEAIPYIVPGSKMMFVDFQSKSFSNIEYVHYNLEYDTNLEATKRGVEGTIYPELVSSQGLYKSMPYYREKIVLGTCSNKHCEYHTGVKNVKMTVHTKYKTGKVSENTKVLYFPNDQF